MVLTLIGMAQLDSMCLTLLHKPEQINPNYLCPAHLQTAITGLGIRSRSPESMGIATAIRKHQKWIMFQLLEMAQTSEQHHSTEEWNEELILSTGASIEQRNGHCYCSI